MAEKPSTQDFVSVRKDIATLLHQPEYDDGSAGPVLVRLAWFATATNTTLVRSDSKPQALGWYLRSRNGHRRLEWSRYAV